MLYNTGLLVGRAYALAHDPRQTVAAAVRELHALAGGDRPSLLLAEARLREFAVTASGTEPERQALGMLTAALERMDASRPVPTRPAAGN